MITTYNELLPVEVCTLADGVDDFHAVALSLAPLKSKPVSVLLGLLYIGLTDHLDCTCLILGDAAQFVHVLLMI